MAARATVKVPQFLERSWSSLLILSSSCSFPRPFPNNRLHSPRPCSLILSRLISMSLHWTEESNRYAARHISSARGLLLSPGSQKLGALDFPTIAGKNNEEYSCFFMSDSMNGKSRSRSLSSLSFFQVFFLYPVPTLGNKARICSIGSISFLVSFFTCFFQ